ncbi:MAG: Na+/H+ antiporter NhaA [Gemmatimonadetes bacterium]|nr:Na+/H+ antiporter NhaA [Gemmatimonadota bacterium]NNM07144.1 Na+/H+ antiporter NhaA [Gemmatimonadota bacterium]
MIDQPGYDVESSQAPTLFRTFAQFFRLEAAGGVLLLVVSAAALILANSPVAEGYFELWRTSISVGVGQWGLTKPALLWVNDGLMALFFFVVGLEIKRELLIGELSSPRKAAVPVAAALGGMLLPAIVFVAFNAGRESASGWGIPMATDIAFALGLLALFARGAPLGLKVFLTAVAIIDDIGAVAVIALFYTAKVDLTALAVALGVLLALFGLNRAKVRSTLPYVLLGLVLWVAVLKSGVHATVAGVILAFFIPARRAVDEQTFLEKARSFLDAFAQDGAHPGPLPTAKQRAAIYSLERLSHQAEAPLARLEHRLHPWVAFLIVPLFAFSNAGVAIQAFSSDLMFNPVTVGVSLGLLLGKPAGVLLFTWGAVRFGLGDLPGNVTWTEVAGIAALCGMGFTMSLFIGGLAFDAPGFLEQAKVGILIGSALSAFVGVTLLRVGRRKART